MGHSHDHNHHHAPQSFNTAFAIAVSLNLAFTIVEGIYAVMANSMSLLGDAAHNLGDVLGLLLAWGASWLLTKPNSVRYSYGYRRSSIIAALINALLLVATGVLIGYESIVKLLNPEPTKELIVIIVASIGILINGGTAILFIKGSKEDLNIKGAYLHLATDALISIGVVFTGIAMMFTGWNWIDPVAGLFIVAIIFYGTWALLRDSVLLIMDAVPASINLDEVREFLMAVEGVNSVHDLHVWGLSTKEIALTAHFVMPDDHLSDEQHKIINTGLKEKFKISHTTIQVEKGLDSDCAQHHTC